MLLEVKQVAIFLDPFQDWLIIVVIVPLEVKVWCTFIGAGGHNYFLYQARYEDEIMPGRSLCTLADHWLGPLELILNVSDQLADQYPREYVCCFNILLLPALDLICDLIMNDLRPSRDEVDFLIGLFLGVDAGVFQQVSVQFASNIIHGHSLLRELALVLAQDLLVRHQEIEKPRMELRKHHHLHSIV